MVTDMKRILILLLIVSLCLLCACNKSETQDPTGTDPQVNQGTEPGNKPEFDWETPIDVDDSFQDVSDETDPVTEPESSSEEDPTEDIQETDPVSGGNQGGNNKPQVTNPSDTSDPTEPENTDDPTEEPVTAGPTKEPEETKKPGSGAIELPMIPG